MSMIHRCTAALALATSVAFAQGAIAADAQKGNILYNQKYGCFQCHGTVGQGSQITSGGRVLSHTKLPYEAFAAFIRNANGAMPPYREQVLPNEDLADIYAYLQSVPADPDYKTIPLLKD